MGEQDLIMLHEVEGEAQGNPTEQLQGVTQESVEYAGFWVRFAAVLVDGLVLAIPSFIINITLGKLLGGIGGYILLWSYTIYMLNTKQATLGKMAVGIKVTTTDGNKPTLGKLALREIVGKILDLITIGIGYLMVVFTGKKQALHDKIADTVVVYDSTRKRRGWIVVLAMIFAVGAPIIGIVSSIALVSLSSAREKAQQAAIMAYGKSILAEMLLCQEDGGNINAYQINKIICDAPRHSMTWPDTSSSGRKFDAPAVKNVNLGVYSFTMSKTGDSDIVCSLSTNDCKSNGTLDNKNNVPQQPKTQIQVLSQETGINQSASAEMSAVILKFKEAFFNADYELQQLAIGKDTIISYFKHGIFVRMGDEIAKTHIK